MATRNIIISFDSGAPRPDFTHLKKNQAIADENDEDFCEEEWPVLQKDAQKDTQVRSHLQLKSDFRKQGCPDGCTCPGILELDTAEGAIAEPNASVESVRLPQSIPDSAPAPSNAKMNRVKKWKKMRMIDLNLWSIKEPPQQPEELMAFEKSKVVDPDGWVKISGVMDSGAIRSTTRSDAVPGYQIRPSEMSRKGQCFVTASGGEIANQGEQVLPTYSDNWVKSDKTLQMADVHRTLFSVG